LVSAPNPKRIDKRDEVAPINRSIRLQPIGATARHIRHSVHLGITDSEAVDKRDKVAPVQCAIRLRTRRAAASHIRQ
jgi:hypothetical protein